MSPDQRDEMRFKIDLTGIHHSVTRNGSKLNETGHKPRFVLYALGDQED